MGCDSLDEKKPVSLCVVKNHIRQLIVVGDRNPEFAKAGLIDEQVFFGRIAEIE